MQAPVTNPAHAPTPSTRTPSSRRIVLLGPQRLQPTAREALALLLPDGPTADDRPVAAITAGWEEREAEYAELREHLDRPVESLDLYRRAEEVFATDPELHGALQQRHGDLRALQTIYRLRLRYLVPAVEELLRRAGPDALMVPEREAAFENLRALDTHHLERVGEMRQSFLDKWQPLERASVARQREEIAALLKRSAALCIAGGHVRILHTRLDLFGLSSLLPQGMPIVAWSAGAMALAERIVLFHDSPPQGRGHAEVLGPGLGLCPGVVALPHAAKRLTLDDEVRVRLLARRFPEDLCVALDENSRLVWDGTGWSGAAATRRLTPAGQLAALERV